MSTTPTTRETHPVTSEILDRLPPHDLDAERGVLGSVIQHPACIDDLGGLAPDEFYADAHRRLFARLQTLIESNRAIDSKLLVFALRDAGEYEAVGGSAYLAEVMQAVPTVAHAAHYAARVRRCARLRDLIHASTETLHDAYDPTLEPIDILDRAESALAKIGTGGFQGDAVELSDALQQAMARLDRQDLRGLFTGIYTLDQLTGGLFPGELSILSARPGVGKTSLAVQIAWRIAGRGRRVCFVSLEMTAAELAARLLAIAGSIDGRVFRCGRPDDSDRAVIVETSNSVASANLAIHDRPGMSLSDVRRAARREVRRGLAFLVIDYLQLITPADRRVARHEQIGQITGGLKELAREFKVPVLCLCQLNREAEHEAHPKLSHLRESGSIEQDADVVLLLSPHEPEDGADHNAELRVAKNRNGDRGVIRLQWEPKYTRFDDPAGPKPFSEFSRFSR